MRYLVTAFSLLALTACGSKSGDRAELECTAQASGLVTDCDVLSESSEGFGKFAIKQVTEQAQCAVSELNEPPVDDGGPPTVACASSHPGFDKPLPRRFRTTWSIWY